MTKPAYKVVDFFEDYGWAIGISLVAIGLGIFKIFFSGVSFFWQVIVVVVLVLGHVFFQYRSLKQQRRSTAITQELEQKAKENEELKDSIEKWKAGLDDFFRNSIIFLYNSMGFTESERISIYKHCEDQFILIGRYSLNPALNEKGRDAYPDDEGFIAQGWRQGEFCMVIEADPSSNFDEYATEVMQMCNINKGTLRDISMHSRSYCINDIKMPVTQEKIGIIVLESTAYSRFGGSDAIEASARINELFNSYISCKEKC